MPGLKGFARWAAREQRAGDHLPYARQVDDHTLALRDGSLMQCLYLDGFAFETADSTDLNHRQTGREAAFRAIADSRLVVYHHIVRRRVSVDTGATGTSPVAAHIAARWQDTLDSRDLYVNDLYVTLLCRPAEGKVGMLDRLRRRGGNDTGGLGHDRRLLEGAMKALMASLERYGVRRLAIYNSNHGRSSEILEFLSSLYNGDMRPVGLPGTDLGRHIPYKRLSIGLDAIEMRGASSADSWFAGLLSMKEYPAHTMPGMLDPLLRLGHELVVSESFAFVDRQVALERMALALRRLKATDDDGHSLRQSLSDAKDAAAAGQAGFGEHHLSVLVKAPTLAALDTAMADTAAALADTGAISVREDVGLEPAFWGQFPGNLSHVCRRALVSTGNFAGLASFHGFPIGRTEGNHWGEAVTLFETSAATPYFFNFHQGDLGHFTVIGPSGAGKTVVMNFLAAQAQKFAPRTVFFDKDRGAEIFLRALGGQYANLRVGRPTGFNPLSLDDTPANRAFLRSLIATLAAPAHGRLDAEEEAVIATAVDASFEQAPAHRRLRYFQELLAGSRRPEADDLAARLAPWHSAGEHAWVFDNAADGLDMAHPTLGFDMTELLDNQALRTPVMMYLFHRIESRLDGTPTLILIDEGWKVLDDPVFAARLRDWMKTLRKRNAIVGFGTQSARDALDSRLSRTITEQAATQIFMPNARATEDDYCHGFGLSAHELDLVRALPAEARCFLVKHGNHSVVVRLDLGGMPDMLTLLSGREASLRRLDALRARYGDEPARWWPDLIDTPWPGPAPEQDGWMLEAAE
ncbi:MAG: VirB4 family type IV secretion/conjugal transfer ATPase [Alphaproteobacteria bacterium]|nr:MAG: VirB4 family type IV secretion/conjugal transfer ATPase [Alphaproteobacteria bacterium]